MTIPILIRSLGYCCPYAFFQVNQNSVDAGLRLGVSDRAIRYARSQATSCEGCEGCLKPLLPRLIQIAESRRHEPPKE